MKNGNYNNPNASGPFDPTHGRAHYDPTKGGKSHVRRHLKKFAAAALMVALTFAMGIFGPSGERLGASFIAAPSALLTNPGFGVSYKSVYLDSDGKVAITFDNSTGADISPGVGPGSWIFTTGNGDFVTVSPTLVVPAGDTATFSFTGLSTTALNTSCVAGYLGDGSSSYALCPLGTGIVPFDPGSGTTKLDVPAIDLTLGQGIDYDPTQGGVYRMTFGGGAGSFYVAPTLTTQSLFNGDIVVPAADASLFTATYGTSVAVDTAVSGIFTGDNSAAISGAGSYSALSTVIGGLTPIGGAGISGSGTTDITLANTTPLTPAASRGDTLTLVLVTQDSASANTVVPSTGYDGDHSVTPVVFTINQLPVATPQTVTTLNGAAVTFTLAGTDADAGQTVTTNVVTQPGSGVLSGTAPSLTWTPANTAAVSTSFTFNVNDGQEDSATTATITLNNEHLGAAPSVTADPTNKYNITFSANLDADNSYPIGTYTWNFGDGSATSAVTSPSHVYSTNGTYNASLTLLDTNGNSVIINFTLTVSVGSAAVGQWVIETQGGQFGETLVDALRNAPLTKTSGVAIDNGRIHESAKEKPKGATPENESKIVIMSNGSVYSVNFFTGDSLRLSKFGRTLPDAILQVIEQPVKITDVYRGLDKNKNEVYVIFYGKNLANTVVVNEDKTIEVNYNVLESKYYVDVVTGDTYVVKKDAEGKPAFYNSDVNNGASTYTYAEREIDNVENLLEAGDVLGCGCFGKADGVLIEGEENEEDSGYHVRFDLPSEESRRTYPTGEFLGDKDVEMSGDAGTAFAVGDSGSSSDETSFSIGGEYVPHTSPDTDIVADVTVSYPSVYNIFKGRVELMDRQLAKVLIRVIPSKALNDKKLKKDDDTPNNPPNDQQKSICCKRDDGVLQLLTVGIDENCGDGYQGAVFIHQCAGSGDDAVSDTNHYWINTLKDGIFHDYFDERTQNNDKVFINPLYALGYPVIADTFKVSEPEERPIIEIYASDNGWVSVSLPLPLMLDGALKVFTDRFNLFTGNFADLLSSAFVHNGRVYVIFYGDSILPSAKSSLYVSTDGQNVDANKSDVPTQREKLPEVLTINDLPNDAVVINDKNNGGLRGVVFTNPFGFGVYTALNNIDYTHASCDTFAVNTARNLMGSGVPAGDILVHVTDDVYNPTRTGGTWQLGSLDAAPAYGNPCIQINLESVGNFAADTDSKGRFASQEIVNIVYDVTGDGIFGGGGSGGGGGGGGASLGAVYLSQLYEKIRNVSGECAAYPELASLNGREFAFTLGNTVGMVFSWGNTPLAWFVKSFPQVNPDTRFNYSDAARVLADTFGAPLSDVLKAFRTYLEIQQGSALSNTDFNTIMNSYDTNCTDMIHFLAAVLYYGDFIDQTIFKGDF